MLEQLAATLTWPILLSAAAAVGAILTKCFTFLRDSRRDKVKVVIDQRRDTVSDRDALIEKYFKDAEIQSGRMDRLEKRIEEAEVEIKQLGERNNALVSTAYKLIAVIRQLNGLHLIKQEDLAPGIHI